jgi:hypothetical protein
VYPVTRGADGWTVTVDDIRTAGNWRVAVTVMRTGLPPVTAAHRWPVAAAQSRPEAAVVSSAPLRPFLNGLIVLVCAALVGLILVAVRRRRRRTGPGPAPDMADVIPAARPAPDRHRALDVWVGAQPRERDPARPGQAAGAEYLAGPVVVNGVLPVALVRQHEDPETRA